MSRFETKCPHCGAALTAQDGWSGAEMECPSCGKKFVLEKKKRRKTFVPESRFFHVLYSPGFCTIVLFAAWVLFFAAGFYWIYLKVRPAFEEERAAEKALEELLADKEKRDGILERQKKCGENFDYMIVVLSEKKGKSGEKGKEMFPGFPIDESNFEPYEFNTELSSAADYQESLEAADALERNVRQVRKAVRGQFEEIIRAFRSDWDLLDARENKISEREVAGTARRITWNVRGSRIFYQQMPEESLKRKLDGDEYKVMRDFRFGSVVPRPKKLQKAKDDFLEIVDYVKKNLFGQAPESHSSAGVEEKGRELSPRDRQEREEIRNLKAGLEGWAAGIEKTMDAVCEGWQVDLDLAELKDALRETAGKIEEMEKSIRTKKEEIRKILLFWIAALTGAGVFLFVVINLCLAVFSMEHSARVTAENMRNGGAS